MRHLCLLLAGLLFASSVAAATNLDVLLKPKVPPALLAKLQALPGFTVTVRDAPDVSGATTSWIIYDWQYNLLASSVKIQLNTLVRDGGRLIVITSPSLDEQKLLGDLRALTSNQILNFVRDKYLSAGDLSTPLSSFSTDPFVDVLKSIHDEYAYPHDGFNYAPVSYTTLLGVQTAFVAKQDSVFGRFDRILLEAVPAGYVSTGLAIPADLGFVNIIGYWDAGCVAAHMLLPAPEATYQQNAQDLINDGPYCPLATVPIGALSGKPALPVAAQVLAFTDTISAMVDADLAQLTASLNAAAPSKVYVAVTPATADPTVPANFASLNSALARVLGFNPGCTFKSTASPSSPPCPAGVAQRPDAFVLPPAPKLLAFTCTTYSNLTFANDDGATVVTFKVGVNGSVVLVGFPFDTASGDQANTWGDYVRGEILNINKVARRCVGDPAAPVAPARRPLPFGRPAVQFAQNPLLLPIVDPVIIDEYFDTLYNATNQPPVNINADVILSKFWSDGPNNVIHIMYDTSFNSQRPETQNAISRRAIYGGETVMIITTPNTDDAFVSGVLSKLIGRTTTVSKRAPLPAGYESDVTPNAVNTLTLSPTMEKIKELMPQVFTSSDPLALPCYTAFRNPSTKVNTGLVYKVGEKGNVIVVGFAQMPTAEQAHIVIRTPNDTKPGTPVTCEAVSQAPFGKCTRTAGTLPYAVDTVKLVPGADANRLVFTLKCGQTCTAPNCLNSVLSSIALWGSRACRKLVSKVEITLPAATRRSLQNDAAEGLWENLSKQQLLTDSAQVDDLLDQAAGSGFLLDVDASSVSVDASRRVLLDPLTPGVAVARYGKWTQDKAQWTFKVSDVGITQAQCTGTTIAVVLPADGGKCSNEMAFVGDKVCITVALGTKDGKLCPVQQFPLV